MKSRSHEIGNLNYHIALKFDRHISSTATEVPVKFQSDCAILNTILWLRDFTRSSNKTCYQILKEGPGVMPALSCDPVPEACAIASLFVSGSSWLGLTTLVIKGA